MVGAFAVSSVVLPFAGVRVTVSVNEPSESVGLPVSPVPLVESAFRPNLEPVATAVAFLPPAGVDCVCIEQLKKKNIESPIYLGWKHY